MENIIINYLEGLFATGTPTDFESAMAGISNVVSDEMNEELDKEPSDEDIKEALFQMHSNKVPEPDGMHALFFQNFWHIVGGDIILFVKNWWRGNIDLK